MRRITRSCVELLQVAADRMGGFGLDFEWLPAGARCYAETGESLPGPSMDAAREADAILLAAMGLPEVRYPDGTEISPQLDLRFEFGLYAGVRPIRAIPGLAPVLADPRAADLDFVIIRESTEGLFASHGKGEIVGDREARETLLITREVCERLFDFAFRLAARRKQQGHPGVLTSVAKANVLPAFAFFRKIFELDALSSRKRRSSLHGVFQLAHVAWPVVT